MNFSYGNDNYNYKSYSLYVRAVQGGQASVLLDGNPLRNKDIEPETLKKKK